MSAREVEVSFVLATCDRREILRTTLAHLAECGLENDDYEVWVVDNGSRDGTVDDLQNAPDPIHAILLPDNHGACAKDHALPFVAGRFVVFLDDDSWPIAGSIQRMLAHFDARPRLAAAGFEVLLPDGTRECAALPDVFVGCGVGLRTAALRDAGGLDRTLFMIAEEYDLTFKLVRRGYEVEVFDDLQVRHLKAPMTRNPRQRAFYDMRNNMLLGWTYLPAPWHTEYLRDWTQRYTWIGQGCDAERMTRAAWRTGRSAGRYRRRSRPYSRLSCAQFRHLFRWDVIDDAMADLHARGARRIAFAGLGKNIYAYYRAAVTHDLAIVAVADDGFVAPGRTYREVPLIASSTALDLDVDAMVISNSSVVHAERTAALYRDVAACEVALWPLGPRTRVCTPRPCAMQHSGLAGI